MAETNDADMARRHPIHAAKIFAGWTAGWIIRQTVKGAAMAVGGYLALHLIGVV